MTDTAPFHSGEQAAQRRVGAQERLDALGRRVIRPFMPEQHRAFFAGLPFLVVAARDPGGSPWLTILAGRPGFVSTPDAYTLDIDSLPVPGDALQRCLLPGADVGLLGIDPATRRRNRANGRIAGAGHNGVRIVIDQSFGNCPRYIHPRNWVPLQRQAEVSASRSQRLSASAQRWIEAADTFFIASGFRGEGEIPHWGMDASHRGGEPGFVNVRDPHTLVFPDYAGNNHFNTIGNLLLDARVGLLFVDFASGHLLQISGRANIDWDSPARAEVPEAQRLVEIEVHEIVEVRNALPIIWP